MSPCQPHGVHISVGNLTSQGTLIQSELLKHRGITANSDWKQPLVKREPRQWSCRFSLYRVL
ncbi:hypothetical protein LZ30DRAFT_743506 [Colletotrichum cereale]|nr:hypothetical protein LZ30DRAFT_743506 [Colletotrichum cereale]